jgi:hypothetical protein
MQILLEGLAEHWPMMAGGLSPALERELGEFLPVMLSSIWSFGFAGITSTYLTMCQYMGKSDAAIAFFAVFLISLGICWNVYENRGTGFSAASVRVFKIDLRLQSLASGCLIVGLSLVLVLFTRLVWVHV